MSCDLLCFKITVKLACKGADRSTGMWWKHKMADRKCIFGCSFYTVWPYSPLPNECVRSSPTGLGWRHLEQTGSDPLPLKLALGGVRTPCRSCSVAAAVAYMCEPETICCAQFWTERLLRKWRYFGVKGHSAFSYWLIWMWMIQISLAKLVKWRKKFPHTWHRGSHTHILFPDPWPWWPVIWSSAGCESTLLCSIFLNIVLWPECRKSVL